MHLQTKQRRKLAGSSPACSILTFSFTYWVLDMLEWCCVHNLQSLVSRRGEEAGPESRARGRRGSFWSAVHNSEPSGKNISLVAPPKHKNAMCCPANRVQKQTGNPCQSETRTTQPTARASPHVQRIVFVLTVAVNTVHWNPEMLPFIKFTLGGHLWCFSLQILTCHMTLS